MLTTTLDLEALRTRLAAVPAAAQAALAGYARTAMPAPDKAAALRTGAAQARDQRLRPDRAKALSPFAPPPLTPSPAPAVDEHALRQAALQGALQALKLS